MKEIAREVTHGGQMQAGEGQTCDLSDDVFEYDEEDPEMWLLHQVRRYVFVYIGMIYICVL